MANVGDEFRGLCTCTREIFDADRRVSVEVFAADRDTNHNIREIVTVCRDGRTEGRQFIVEGSLAGRAPEAEQERGFRVDGGRNGFDGGVCGVALDHGVETGTRPARRANEILCRGEERLKVRLRDGRAVGKGRAVVEALVDRGRGTRHARRDNRETERMHRQTAKGNAKMKRKV